MRLTDKCLREIDEFEEGVLSEPEYRGKKARAMLNIDITDEKNLSQNDQSESEYFYMTNKHNVSTNLKKVDVKVNVDSDEGTEVHEAIRKRLTEIKCCK